MSKLLVAGSRGMKILPVVRALDGLWLKYELVTGMCPNSPDEVAYELWARVGYLRIWKFPADWERYGKRAGMIRNASMARACDYAVIFWDGRSSGTLNMMQQLVKNRKSFTVYTTVHGSVVYKSLGRYGTRYIVRALIK